MKKSRLFLSSLIIILYSACAPRSGGDIRGIVYTVNGRIYSILPQADATPVSLSDQLDSLSALPPGGSDAWASVSPNGDWILLATDRFGLSAWTGLVLLRSDLESAQVVRDYSGEAWHADYSAVASSGRIIVLCQVVTNIQHVFVITNLGNYWINVACLSSATVYSNQGNPRISADGTQVLFDGGLTPYSQEGTAVFRANIDGSGYTNLVGPLSHAGGNISHSVRSPAFAPDGSIVFEADWNGEQIWRLVPGSTDPVVINSSYQNDNSPTVLQDGRVVSLWLDRPGGSGTHEIKIMNADGTGGFVILENVDVSDIGLTAGR